jgi:uncharacterized protein (DUF2236 family)
MNLAMNRGEFGVVDAEALERELGRVQAAAAGSLPGIFGPRSLAWRVNREAVVFLGAGRALLLQLAHPWIAAAIEQHSDTFANPIARFQRTFSTMFTLVFGTLDESLAAARRLHRRHAAINGRLQSTAGPFPAGSVYSANAVPVLRWVHATLADTALLARAIVLPPIPREERELYWSESRILAGLFGVPEACLAPDWSSFTAYFQAITQSEELTVTDAARVMANRLLSGAGSWLPVPTSYRALTASLLPPRLRDAFALPYGDAEQLAADRLIAGVRWAYPLLPARLRFVGPYQWAQQRLAGKTGPDFMTRMNNRFWIGRPDLPTGGWSPE